MIPLLTFYGDDFTGSTDALEVLSLAGLTTRLFLSAETLFSSLSLSPSEVQSPVSLGLAGVSRNWTPAQMETDFPAFFTAMRKLKSPLFHVK
ncbi:MAG: four-carbon acid sugar kinase family protein, partial [Chthonomonadaceae bacterium]|nr:four-carbon acid sugar kinase family protein [Chthonomonadaceae bacterium]